MFWESDQFPYLRHLLNVFVPCLAVNLVSICILKGMSADYLALRKGSIELEYGLLVCSIAFTHVLLLSQLFLPETRKQIYSTTGQMAKHTRS